MRATLFNTQYPIDPAAMALSAADYDVRGAVPCIDASALVYDIRQRPLTDVPPSPLPFDLSALSIDDANAPPSPLPFDLSALSINNASAPPSPLPFDLSASAPPSPLPFDLAALSIAEPVRPPNETLIAVINAIDAADYATLERFAAAGYDFNSCAASRNELGMSPLNRIVHEHPWRGTRFDAWAACELIKWLCAHGARPTQPDSFCQQDMWTVLIQQTNYMMKHPTQFPDHSGGILNNYHRLWIGLKRIFP